MLLIALPNEHLLTFSQYKNAKTFFKAIQERFGGNDAIKKIQRTLLKHMYENFNASGQSLLTQSLTGFRKFDATVYAFLANQPNGSQLVHKDLEQIHGDDLEEKDLKWQLGLLSIRARSYFQRTGKKITINGSDTASYDKTKVECFNCHKMGHFAREFKSPRNQENRLRNQDSSRKTVNVKDTSSKAMVETDGAGFDWSYMVDDEVPTNMALTAFSDSEVSNSDEDESEEMVLKSDNVQHKPEQANQPRKMVQTPLLKNVEKGTVQREVRPVWNNAMRTNHQNFSNSRRNFAPTVVLTKSRIVPISTARKNAFQKSHSLSRRPFYQHTALEKKILNNKVNNAKGAPQDALKDQGYFDSGCSRHMTGNISYLTDFKEHDGGYVTFGGGDKGGKITGKGTIRIDKLDSEDVYFVKELQFNLFNVSWMCDKKNSVLFTDTECFVLSPDFKLADESQVLLKAINDESMLWHMRLGHINFKNINKLVKDNLVRGLPLKHFKNDQTCVACLKGKQHKVSFKSKPQNSISQPLFMLHMDLFGPTSVKPHFKTTYELFKGRSPALSFMRPFGCHITILNTLDQLGKFDGKSDEGIFVGYSTISKPFRVYNIRTRKVEENLHITFLENKPMIAGGGPEWLFDNDSLSKLMNYAPVPAGTTSNDFAGKERVL
nr:hypothetical protein [Tanacetum cinerariifolium]